MSVIITVEHGVERRFIAPPAGMILYSSYCPHSCPWDYYGMKQVMEWTAIMKKAGLVKGVEWDTRNINKRNLAPCPSGPNGTVRFGDDMIPGDYQLWIHPDRMDEVKSAIQAHDEEVKDWLAGNRTMPDTLRPAC